MKEQRNQFIQGEALLQPHIPSKSDESESDFLKVCQTGISSIEITSSSFYIMQKIEMFLITIISSSALFTEINKSNSIISVFNHISSLCFFSPQIYENSLPPFFVIGCILLSLFLMIGFTLSIGNKFQKNIPVDQKIIKLWMIFTHLLLPIPGHIIGYHFGYYFFELTHDIHEFQLLIITFSAVIWCWTLITCNSIYHSDSIKRKSDNCQVHHKYISFHNIVLIFPMVQGMMPGLIKSFFPNIDFYLYTFFIFFISLFMSLFILKKKPYEHVSMNKFVKFIFVIRVPLSFIPIIEKHFGSHFESYLFFISLFIILSFLLLINPFSTVFNSKEKVSHNKKSQETKSKKVFDPTIDLPFPFNRVSLTKQDIFLYVFVFSIVIFMNLLNAIAAQRVPATAPLLDFIHNRFMVSKCIRTNITKAISQISNDFILFQIALLFFILFVFPEHFDFRRAVFIYGCICFIRAISFCITSLPVPCAGEPNCPCADRANIKLLRSGNPIKIAMSWLFGLGMFLKYPQCGDLIISGHTICIWLFTRTCATALNSAIQRPFNWFVSGFLYTFSFFTMMYIVLSKNHYSIDVWFGFILTELFWTIYNAILKLSMLPAKESDSFYVKLVRWIEKRPERRALIVNQKLKEEVMKN